MFYMCSTFTRSVTSLRYNASNTSILLITTDMMINCITHIVNTLCVQRIYYMRVIWAFHMPKEFIVVYLRSYAHS